MFKKHEEAITQILTANTKIVNEEIQKLTNKIVDFQESLEFTQKELSDKIKKVEHHVDDNIEWMTWKIRNLEDRSRQNNLRIDGLPESLNESWKITEEKVQHLFKETLKFN